MVTKTDSDGVDKVSDKSSFKRLTQDIGNVHLVECRRVLVRVRVRLEEANRGVGRHKIRRHHKLPCFARNWICKLRKVEKWSILAKCRIFLSVQFLFPFLAIQLLANSTASTFSPKHECLSSTKEQQLFVWLPRAAPPSYKLSRPTQSFFFFRQQQTVQICAVEDAILTRASIAAGGNFEQTPEVWLTSIAPQSADARPTGTLTGLDVTETSVRAERVTLAQTCIATDISHSKFTRQ